MRCWQGLYRASCALVLACGFRGRAPVCGAVGVTTLREAEHDDSSSCAPYKRSSSELFSGSSCGVLDGKTKRAVVPGCAKARTSIRVSLLILLNRNGTDAVALSRTTLCVYCF